MEVLVTIAAVFVTVLVILLRRIKRLRKAQVHRAHSPGFNESAKHLVAMKAVPDTMQSDQTTNY
jgi:hypothetical protein